jgi:hypothetical protein
MYHLELPYRRSHRVLLYYRHGLLISKFLDLKMQPRLRSYVHQLKQSPF